MYTHHILLILHLVAATIWVGGHLVLAIGYLPKALKHNDFSYIGNFEKTYEPIGMPSLLVLVITGILMAYDYGVSFSTWLHFDFSIEKVVSLKLLCLLSRRKHAYYLSCAKEISKNYLKWQCTSSV